jgi:hypothetical protein
MTKQVRWEYMQERWRKAIEAARTLQFDLKYHYGETYSAPRAKREKLDRLWAREASASDAIFAWLDANSPRQWRTGVPAYWICGDLSFADALTSGHLSVIPPVCYGSFPSDSIRFAAAVSA